MHKERSPNLADDLLTGAEEIGDYIGVSPRRVFYLAEKKLAPIFKVGRQLHARKSELEKAYSAEGASK